MKYWLVHSDTVKIQGWSQGRGGNNFGIAIGGEYLKDHRLVAWIPGGRGQIKVKWDDEEILKEDGQAFKEDNLCDLHRHAPKTKLLDEEELKKLDGKHDWWEKNFNGNGMGSGKKHWQNSRHSVYHFKLPGGVEMWLTSHDNMEVLVKIHSCRPS